MNAVILVGDVRERLSELPDKSVRCVVTSPPYWGLRDYGHDGQLGLEPTPDEYVKNMVAVFDDVWRVLADDGTLWLNLGDSYASFRDGKATPDTSRGEAKGTLVPKGSAKNRSASSFAGTGVRHKSLVGIPWRVAFALQDAGWILRQDIIWAKPNPMPESVKDRCTKSHEYLFLLSKNPRYYFDADAMAEPAKYDFFRSSDQKQRFGEQELGDRALPPRSWNGSAFDTGKTAEHQMQRAQSGESRSMPRFGGAKCGDSDDPRHATKSGNEYQFTGTRNKRDVWTIPTQPFKGAHFAVMPEALVTPCVLAGSAEGDTVLDPFSGSGTVGVVSLRHQRNYVGIELNPEYAEMSRNRIKDDAPMLNEVE